MGVFKVVENCERTRRGDFEDGAETKSSSSRCHTIEGAVIGLHQSGVGSFPIRTVEVVQNGQHTCWRQLKYDTEAVGATLGGCSIKIAVGALNYRANRPCSEGLVELVDESDFTGRRHFEHRAASRGRRTNHASGGHRFATEGCRSVEVAIAALHQGSVGVVTSGAIE
jgi:hypothetical protein